MKGPNTEKIEKMFDSIAPDYDKLNHILSLDIDKTWRSRAIKEVLAVEPGVCDAGEAGGANGGGIGDKSGTGDGNGTGTDADACGTLRVLDVACGTGDFSIAMARRFRKATGKRGTCSCKVSGENQGQFSATNIKITGLDLSEGMLSVMAKKVEAAGFNDVISAMQGNSEKMPFADNSFDVVTISFGIRNFEHREVALKEILRVLRPGGRLVILELSVPTNAFVRWGYFLYFKNILPRIGGRISGDQPAYNYLPASVLKFPSKEEWMATMAACGYEKVTHRAFTFEICRLYTGTKPTLD